MTGTTEHVTISKPQNPEIDELCVVEKRRSADCEALNMSNVWSVRFVRRYSVSNVSEFFFDSFHEGCVIRRKQSLKCFLLKCITYLRNFPN